MEALDFKLKKDKKCIVCNEPSFGWFCPYHVSVKEAAYAEAKKLGLKTHEEVMELRDKRLIESKLKI